MATKKADDVLVQMATRVPASLLHAVKVFCVEREVAVMDFVAEALREKLRRAGIRRV
jgi:hypothetical protein